MSKWVPTYNNEFSHGFNLTYSLIKNPQTMSCYVFSSTMEANETPLIRRRLSFAFSQQIERISLLHTHRHIVFKIIRWHFTILSNSTRMATPMSVMCNCSKTPPEVLSSYIKQWRWYFANHKPKWLREYVIFWYHITKYLEIEWEFLWVLFLQKSFWKLNDNIIFIFYFKREQTRRWNQSHARPHI